MASPSKLSLLLSCIPLGPQDSPKLSYKSQTNQYLSPIRYRKSNLRPKHLPKLSTHLKMASDFPQMSELVIKLAGPSKISKIEQLLQTKIKLNVIPRTRNDYIKKSYQRVSDSRKNKFLSPQSTSPIPEINRNTSTHQRSKTSINKNMVDATFNTD